MSFIPSVYGSMYIYTLGVGSAVSVAATDTFYQVSSGVSSDSGTTKGFTFQNSRELKALSAGTYEVVWSLSVEVASANQEVEGTIAVNYNSGTHAGAITRMAAHTEQADSGRPFTLSGSGIVALSANDLVSMVVLNHSAIHDISIDHLTLTITRVDN